MEMNDFMTMNALEKEGMTPYEQFKVSHMQSKRASGTSIGALSVGVGAAVLGVGAWIFGGFYANAKSAQAKEVAISAKELANVQIAASQRQIDQLTALMAAERQERISGDFTLNQTITDTVSGQQASTLTAQQQAELAASQATQQVMTQTYSDFVTGRASLNPTPVSLYSSPQPCACPASGCGCGCNG